MSKPKRIQLRRTKGWRMPENTVSVARPGRWGNPFRVGMYATEVATPKAFVGGLPCGYPYSISLMGEKSGHTLIHDAADAVRRYRDYLTKWPRSQIEELRGKHLACWCAEGPCHADVLLELANP